MVWYVVDVIMCEHNFAREFSESYGQELRDHENILLAARYPQFQTRITIVRHVAKFIEINQIYINNVGS